MTEFVSYVSDEAIEKDAQALLDEYAHARGVGIEPPIAIDDIIEKHLKIGIKFDDTHRLFGDATSGHRVRSRYLGAIFFDQKRIVIVESLDPDANPGKEGRYRYTAAHEVGHCTKQVGAAVAGGAQIKQTVRKLGWGDSRIAGAILELGMAHISGLERDQLLLLPEAVDDYVGSDNPVRFMIRFP